MSTFPYNGDGEDAHVLAPLASAFQSNQCFVRPERYILFVCGGSAVDDTNSRARFLVHAAENFANLRVLLAEDAYKDLVAGSHHYINLATFEKTLAELADCIVIFPESAGSFAELGFFSAHRALVTKTLAVNHIDFQSDDSFLSLGPLALVDNQSNYRPTLHAQDDHGKTMAALSGRLKRLTQVRRRQRLNFGAWDVYAVKQRLFITFEIIRLLRVIHAATLPHVIKEMFGGIVNKNEIKRLVSVLVAAKLISRVGDDERYLVAMPGSPFMDIPEETEHLASANSYLLKHHAQVYAQAFAG